MNDIGQLTQNSELGTRNSQFPSPSVLDVRPSTLAGSSDLRPLTSGFGSRPKARLVYILSASHSGSTLLAMLLGAHPALCTVGELKATNLGDPARYRCSCRHLIQECGFWNAINDSMRRKGISDFAITNAGTSIYEVPGRYARRLVTPLFRGRFLEAVRDVALNASPQWRSHRRQVEKRNYALIHCLQEKTGAGWVVDSSKVALRLKYLLQTPDLEIRVIRLVRDGRAVALTYTDEWNFADAKDPALRGGGSGQPRKNAQDSMLAAAREWRRSNESADCLVSQLPRDQWIHVRYEDVCTATEATLKQIYQFLSVDPNLATLDFRARGQHVIGNGMRLDSSSEIQLDERWKTHLSQADLQTFDTEAGHLNRQYGYQ